LVAAKLLFAREEPTRHSFGNQVPAKVLDTIAKMDAYRKWTDLLLREKYDKAAEKSRQKLHASLVLLPVDATRVKYLQSRLLEVEPHELPVIRDTLERYKDTNAAF
jgi:hypothetical protein